MFHVTACSCLVKRIRCLRSDRSVCDGFESARPWPTGSKVIRNWVVFIAGMLQEIYYLYIYIYIMDLHIIVYICSVHMYTHTYMCITSYNLHIKYIYYSVLQNTYCKCSD